MGFLKPKLPAMIKGMGGQAPAQQIPTPPPPANPAIYAKGSEASDGADIETIRDRASFIGTSSRGLTRRANTQRRSLIGG